MSYSESQYPVVSVLIPVYNAETYIGRCLDSILSQDYPALEVVAIDDGSSDSSFSILENYERRHPSVVRAYHQQNQGVAATRNKAISLASGVYLMFADNDDYLEPGSIKLLVHKALEADADIICAGFQRPDTHGTIVSRVILSSDTQWAPYKVSAAWAKLYRTAFIKDNSLSFLSTNIGEDIYFTLPAQCFLTKRSSCLRLCTTGSITLKASRTPSIRIRAIWNSPEPSPNYTAFYRCAAFPSKGLYFITSCALSFGSSFTPGKATDHLKA